MNQIEITIFGISMLLLAGYTAFSFSDGWKARSFSIPLLLAPLVYLALESTTEFLTNDAAFHFFREIYSFGTSDMNQYRLGGFRTSEMLLAPLVPVITKIVQTPIEVAAILKGIHWLFGFLLLLWIHAASQPLVTGNRATYFMLFMVVALLLPTNILALKIFNYDKLSLFLGLLGLIYVLRALSSHDPGRGSNKESTNTSSKAWRLAFAGLVCLWCSPPRKNSSHRHSCG